MEQYREQLSSVRQRLEPLENELALLRQEEKRLIRILDRLAKRDGTAPIHSIPDEILREIFVHTLPTARERVVSNHALSLRSAVSPAVLCHVCKWWRKVALGFPHLWANLRLLIETSDSERDTAWGPIYRKRPLPNSLARCVNRWKELARTGALQLQLVVPQKLLMAFLKPFLLTSLLGPTEWGRLSTLTICNMRRWDVVGLPTTSLVSLRDLIMSFVDYKERTTPQPLQFADCPHLHRVAIDRLVDSRGNLLMTLPWNQLTSLIIIEPTSPHHISPCLQHCAAIQFLHLASPSRYGPYAQPEIKEFPSLLRLSVATVDHSHPLLALSHLQSYRPDDIKVLRLMDSTVPSDYSIQGEHAFITWVKNVQKLESLAMSGDSPPFVSSYESLFEHTYDLQTLELRHQRPRPYFTQAQPALKGIFRTLEENPRLLPKLTAIVVQIDPDSVFDDRAFLSFVKRRTRAEPANPDDCHPPNLSLARLERITIVFGPDTAASARLRPTDPGTYRSFDELKELEQDGLFLDLVKVDVGSKDYVSSQLEWEYCWVDRDPFLTETWPEVRDLFFKGEHLVVWNSDDSDSDSDSDSDDLDSDSDND